MLAPAWLTFFNSLIINEVNISARRVQLLKSPSVLEEVSPLAEKRFETVLADPINQKGGTPGIVYVGACKNYLWRFVYRGQYRSHKICVSVAIGTESVFTNT